MTDRSLLQRKQIYLEHRMIKQLKITAKKNHLTESAVIRRALEEYLAAEERRNTPEGDNPVLRMIGAFADGDKSHLLVSEDKGRYLNEALIRDKV